MEEQILGIKDKIAASGKPAYFPFAPYRGQSLRTFQGYLVKVPSELMDLIGLDVQLARPDPAPLPPVQPSRLGVSYRKAPRTTVKKDTEPWSRDPGLVDRALRSHAETQEDLSEALRAAGLTPRSPSPGEPDYDIAWETDEARLVGEVKSLTARNEEKQLRLGLGQVLRYANLLSASTAKPVIPVMALEREPSDHRWLQLCDALGVRVGWVGSWSSVVNG